MPIVIGISIAVTLFALGIDHLTYKRASTKYEKEKKDETDKQEKEKEKYEAERDQLIARINEYQERVKTLEEDINCLRENNQSLYDETKSKDNEIDEVYRRTADVIASLTEARNSLMNDIQDYRTRINNIESEAVKKGVKLSLLPMLPPQSRR